MFILKQLDYSLSISMHDSINLLVFQNSIVLQKIFFPRGAWVSFNKTREGETSLQ